MKNLKKELLKLCEATLASGEYDNTELAGRYILGDNKLDDFAGEHGLCEDEAEQDFDREAIEKACGCQIIYDYEGADPNRQFGNQEVIFNEEKKLYIVSV